MAILKRQCRTCLVIFDGGPRAYYCHSCRYERKLKTQRESKAKSRKGQTRKLGSIDKCVRCGKEYIIRGSLQKHCETCQPIHTKEYDRKVSLEYYHLHKNRINPIRNLKRRKHGVHCTICGKTLPPKHKLTCSNKCLTLHIKNYQMQYHKARKGKIPSL